MHVSAARELAPVARTLMSCGGNSCLSRNAALSASINRRCPDFTVHRFEGRKRFVNCIFRNHLRLTAYHRLMGHVPKGSDMLTQDSYESTKNSPERFILSPSQESELQELLAYFGSKPKAKGMLEERARLVALLVLDNCNVGPFWAAEIRNKDPNNYRHVRLGKMEVQQARAETAAFFIALVMYPAFNSLSDKDGAFYTFVDALVSGVTTGLQTVGVEGKAFQDLFRERYDEYRRYRKWFPEKNEGYGGTLFWEFAKKVAAPLCISENIMFSSSIMSATMHVFVDWKLDELLSSA